MSKLLGRLKLRLGTKSSSSSTAPLNELCNTTSPPLPVVPISQQINPSATSSSGGPALHALHETDAANCEPVYEKSLPSLPVEKKSGWSKVTYSSFKISLDLAAEAANSFAPLKSAVGMLSVLLTNYDQAIDNKKQIEELVPKIKSMMDSLMHTSDDGRKMPIHKYAERELLRRREFRRSLDGAYQKLEELSSLNGLVRFLNNADQRSEIVGVVEDVREGIVNYQTSLQRDLYEMNSDMYAMNSDVVTLNREHAQFDHVNLLDKLPYAKAAGYRSGNREPCLKGTRIEILHEIEKWAVDEYDHPVFWLGGVAGTGKTTVAQSFAERAFAEGRLGASFFCSRGVTDRSNIDLIFPTLAFDLATQFHQFRPIIANVIKDNPRVGYESLAHQLRNVLVDPLQCFIEILKADPVKSKKLPIVFIIDALDECEDDKAESAILSVLATQLGFMASVKFFVTSRPVGNIRAAFRQQKLDKLTRRSQLHKVDQAIIDRDMKLFFVTRLPKEVENREDFTPPHPWPAAKEVSSLVKNSGGLFIYASTILKFITSRDHEPDERLRLIINMADTFLTGEAGLDHLYVQILIQELANSAAGDFNIFSDFRLVVGCILLAFNPISRTGLAKLLDTNPNHISRVLRNLHSVLIVPDAASDPITTAHKSFPDFLTHSSRCRDSRFYIDRNTQHGVIGIQCLKLMEKDLKKNVCSIPDRTPNKEVKDLTRLRQECIGDALEYACRFFGKHIREAPTIGGEVVRIVERLKTFAERLLLQWLEILSIVDDMRAAVHSLNDIKGWLVKVIIDCHRFVLKFFDIIEESATYIYDFALPWCPRTSLLRRRYGDELATKVKVVKGLESSWDRCSRTIHQIGFVKTVLFSHDGRLIVGAGDNLGIYEAATGACLMTIQERAAWITISPDDSLLTSADGKRAKVWDIQTGELVRVFNGHTGDISCVAFSPSGKAIASGSQDQTVKIWDLSSGDCSSTLECNSIVRSVCWRGDKNQVLYGLQDGTFNVGDVLTKTRLKTIQGPPLPRSLIHSYDGSIYIYGPQRLTTSPDGLTFTSGSNDGRITIYDSLTLIPLKTFPVPESQVHPLSFSSKGDQIVYCSGDKVHMLDLEHGSTTPILDTGSDVWSASVLSPDGSIILSPYGTAIKLWQREGRISHHNYVSVRIKFVRITADEHRITCRLADGTITVWDSHTGKHVNTIQGVHGIHSLDISRATSFFISSYKDGHLRLQDFRNPDFNATVLSDIRSPSVRFSADGSQIMVSPSLWRSNDNSFTERWEICLSPLGLRLLGKEQFQSSELPYRISDVQWVVDRDGRRVCWLPPDYRYLDPRTSFDASKSKFALFSYNSGKMAIIDFSNLRS